MAKTVLHKGVWRGATEGCKDKLHAGHSVELNYIVLCNPRTQVGGTFSAVAVPAGSFDVASDKSPGPLITASSTGEIARSNALTSIRTMEV